MNPSRTTALAGAWLLTVATAASAASADSGSLPWSDPGDLPLALWAKSVAPAKDEVPIFTMPNRTDPRRGTLGVGARPPLYGALRGSGCGGRWLLIGPFAWVCSDEADASGDEPRPPAFGIAGPFASLPAQRTDDGLAFRHYFVGPEGASGFRDLAHAEEDSPEVDFEPGFAVAIAEEQNGHGERWGKTRHGMWVALRQLNAAHPTTLHGERLDDSPPGEAISVAWVLPEHATTYADAAGTKRAGVRLRFDVIHWHQETGHQEKGHEEKGTLAAKMVRISDDGAEPAEWMHAHDLAHPTIAEPPAEVGGRGATERWIDVDLSTQTLVAYEGTKPAYAALVSAGRGAQGTETATPIGVHRIWVKLLATTMDNLENEDVENHYSIEDVPYVQFFAKGAALHGTFWHRRFGAPHSHGCVNLSPVDARWLFDFTAPHLLAGWSAALPVRTEPGTVVRVR